MKKIVILLFLTGISFAQNHHFKAERKEVTWQMAFKTKQTDILNLIDKNHTKISVNKEDNSGSGHSLQCDCKKGGWYFEQSFNLNFTVEFKEDNYLVTVSEIIFDGEGETNANNRLENYVLRMGQNVFHTTEKNLINLNCLEAYFIKLFQIPESEITTF
ncbi:hypothetical protein [Flavobacterium sp.]|jgi:hypothetical protein|uniref:hypothetical protein n=1 Tax=Flavobacterium sp. TaxID=239 RepID=UPI0037C0F270